MDGTLDSFDSLWAYCTADGRAVPRMWNRLYKKLANTSQNPNGSWNPPLPLILAAWEHSSPLDKHLRFMEHVQWACDQGQLAEIGGYLRSLTETDWYHFGEL